MRSLFHSSREPQFSQRTAWDTTQTEWAQLLSDMRQKNLPVYDLTAANPAECGFTYDPELLTPLLQSEAYHYRPEPRGLSTARNSVCRYYQERSGDHQQVTSLNPDQICLTTSTSEAYSFLFRLLCDPDDEVIFSQPSYPLFDFLATLDDVRLLPAPLFYDYGWHLDIHAVRQQITSRTRAIIVVHPNNPTGHFTSLADRLQLEAICAEHGLALIVDEVFLDYGFAIQPPSFTVGEHPVLTFVLSGLSKIVGLPQMKLSWIAALGPKLIAQSAIERIEVIADTFLSVNTPAQLALPTWLKERSNIQKQIKQRTMANLTRLDHGLTKNLSLGRLHLEGGWYATLRAPQTANGEQLAFELLRDDGVAIHPGSFFGMPNSGFFVVSLLAPPEMFERGTDLLISKLG